MGLDMKYIVGNRREDIYLEQILEWWCRPNLYSEIDVLPTNVELYKSVFEIFKAPLP